MENAREPRDHGGGLDAARARFGGARGDWLDLSTGINPIPYPLGQIAPSAWEQLPDGAAMADLLHAARAFWNVPGGAQIIAAPGASALIAAMPDIAPGSEVFIPGPTYNEHAAAFGARNWYWGEDAAVPVHVYVHPNNPDGRRWPASAVGKRSLTIIDESFCDVAPEASHIALTDKPGVIVLKSFGKFWGLAGLRLGFAIGHPDTLAPDWTAGLADRLGPWPVAGPALAIGTRALGDLDWATRTRARLAHDAIRLDALLTARGATLVGGTDLFRTYAVANALGWQTNLARHHIWTRIFPYSQTWIRFGLPGSDAAWDRLRIAL